MRLRISIFAFTALLLALASWPASAQESVPDSPQPQKKQDPKPPRSSDTSAADAKPDDEAPPKEPASKNDNAFPEEVSREAAAKAAQQDDKSPAEEKRPTPEANPFPEDVSRDAAKAAGNAPSSPSASKGDLPPGVSSSQSQGSVEGLESGHQITDPVRAKKDAEVGGFYLKTGNFHGALLRFQDASATDPTNVTAIFGLAEAQRMLGQTADAARNYQLYLDIVPNGPKAKESMKALKTLRAAK